MESTLGGDHKPSQLVSYGGDDPLAIAMAQSGIETGDQWSFLDLRPGPEDTHPDFSPPSSLRPGADFGPAVSLNSTAADFGQMTCLQSGDDFRLLEDRLHGQLDEEEEEEEEEEMEDRTAAAAAAGDGGSLDGWLSSYYYTVDNGATDPDGPDPDPDDPDPDPDSVGLAGPSPSSALPRLVASLGWTDPSRPPPYTFEELAALAICSAPERRLTVELAAQFVSQVYPFYGQHGERVQARLQQALFASPFFRRVPGRGPLGRPWTVTAEGERRLAAAVRQRLASPSEEEDGSGGGGPWRPARPVWLEDHCYAAERPAATAVTVAAVGSRRRVKLATKT